MADAAVVGILRALLTADTASFDAGMRKAASTSKTTEKAISGLGTEVKKLTPQAERMVKAFQGDKLLYQANNLVASVQKLGGVSKLTDTEMRRVNGTLNEAISKYKALGQSAPKAMADLAAASSRAMKPLDAIARGMTVAGTAATASSRLIAGMGTAGRKEMERLTTAVQATSRASQFMQVRMVALGAALGTFASSLAGRAIRAVIDFGREAFQSAGHIVDLGNKTGLSTRTIQQMQFVAKQTGGSLDTFTGAAFQLGIQLQSTNKDVRAAIEELRKYGVDSERLKASRPDEQWNTVTRALGMVTSAGERNRLGLVLMGRSYKDLASAAAEGYQRIASQAKVSTDAQLRELDRLNDEWQKWKANLSTGFGAAMGRIALETRIRGEVAEEYFRRRREEPGFKGFPSDDFAGRHLNVEEEAQRRLQLMLVDQRKTDIALTKEQAQAQDFYRARLKAVNDELRSLKPVQRAELDAALKLGADSLDELEQKFKLTSGALRIYQADIKDATRETNKFNELLQKFNAGPEAKRQALDIVEAMTPDKKTGKAILDLSRMAEEDQRKVGEALLDGVRAWIVAKEEVPKSVSAQLAAVLQLRMMPDLVKEIADDMRMGLGALAGADTGSADAEAVRNERSFQNLVARLDARKTTARTIRDTELAAAEFGIEQAKRWGATWQDVYRMEAQLSRRRLDASVVDTNAAFTERIREMRTSGEIEDATMQAMQAEHKAHVDQMVEDWRQGEIAKRDELRLTHDLNLRLYRQLKEGLSNIGNAATSGLFSMFLPTGDQGREAREEYEQLRRSGTASAEAITQAFRRMKEEQSGFFERFKGWAHGILNEFRRLVDDMVGLWVREFLGGLMRSIARSAFGQKLTGWLTSAIPGLGGLGIGIGAASAIPGAAAAPSLAALLGAAPVAAGTTAAASTTAAGTAAAGGGAGFLAAAATPALIAAGALLLFNDIVGLSGHSKGFSGNNWAHRLIKQMTGHDSYIDAYDPERGMTRDGAMKTFRPFGSIKKFAFTPPSLAVPSMTGMSLGAAGSSTNLAAARSGGTVHNHYHNWNTIDGKSTKAFVESPAFTNSFGRVVENNTGFIASRVSRAINR